MFSISSCEAVCACYVLLDSWFPSAVFSTLYMLQHVDVFRL